MPLLSLALVELSSQCRALTELWHVVRPSFYAAGVSCLVAVCIFRLAPCFAPCGSVLYAPCATVTLRSSVRPGATPYEMKQTGVTFQRVTFGPWQVVAALLHPSSSLLTAIHRILPKWSPEEANSYNAKVTAIFTSQARSCHLLAGWPG